MEPKIRLKGFTGEREETSIGDISTSFSGGTPSVDITAYYGGDIPFIRSGEVGEDRTQLFITAEGLNSSSARMVEKGTLLYALYGVTSGEVSISKINGAIYYADSSTISETLEYDMRAEREFSYAGLPVDDAIRHLMRFCANLWQIHAFCEGNTRTTAVFM